MFGLLAKVVVGVAVISLAGMATYSLYKCLTRDTIKEEINENAKYIEVFKEAFKAKYKEKKENGEIFSFEVMDKWDEPLGDIDLYGDEIASDIEIGDEIILID